MVLSDRSYLIRHGGGAKLQREPAAAAAVAAVDW
jgi:hypothetical protein